MEAKDLNCTFKTPQCQTAWRLKGGKLGRSNIVCVLPSAGVYGEDQEAGGTADGG